MSITNRKWVRWSTAIYLFWGQEIFFWDETLRKLFMELIPRLKHLLALFSTFCHQNFNNFSFCLLRTLLLCLLHLLPAFFRHLPFLKRCLSTSDFNIIHYTDIVHWFLCAFLWMASLSKIFGSLEPWILIYWNWVSYFHQDGPLLSNWDIVHQLQLLTIQSLLLLNTIFCQNLAKSNLFFISRHSAKYEPLSCWMRLASTFLYQLQIYDKYSSSFSKTKLTNWRTRKPIKRATNQLFCHPTFAWILRLSCVLGPSNQQDHL